MEDIATLGIRVDSRDADTASHSLDKLTNSGKDAERATDSLKSAFDGLKGILAGLAIKELAEKYADLTDEGKKLTSQLKLATQEFGSFAQAQKDVRSIAVLTRSDLGATAELYATFARQAKDAGISQKQVAQITTTVNEAFKVSGATTEEASGSIRQLTQAFASGVLRGDEFNSMMEGAPRLAKLLADSLGVNVGKLRAMAAAGELTRDKLARAFSDTKFTDGLQREFDQLPATFSDAMGQIHNAAVITLSAFDEGGQFSRMFINFALGGAKSMADLERSAREAGQDMHDTFAGLADAFDPFIVKVQEAIGWLQKLSAASGNASEDSKSFIAGSMQDIDRWTGWLAKQGIGGGLLTGNNDAFGNKLPGADGQGTHMYRDYTAGRKREEDARKTQSEGGFAGRYLDKFGAPGSGDSVPSINAKTDATKKHQKAVKDLTLEYKNYIATLQDDTFKVGKDEDQIKAYEIEKEALKALKAGHAGLAEQIRSEGAAYIAARKEQKTTDVVKEINDETAAVGKNAYGLRQLSVEKEISAAASDKEKEAIRQAAIARETAYNADAVTQFEQNIIEPMNNEIQLLGKVGVAREKEALELEKNTFLREQERQGITNTLDALQAWEQYKAGQTKIIDFNENIRQTDDFIDRLHLLGDAARDMSDNMSDAFGKVGGSIGSLIANVVDYKAAQEDIENQVLKGSKSQETATMELANLNSKFVSDQIKGVKSLFSQKSTAYKIMTGLEKAYAALELINSIKSIVQDTTKTASSVANSMTRGVADQAAGAAKIFAELGPWAFPVVAAMVGILAALGLKGGGGGGGGVKVPTAEEMQKTQGTGSVLGDNSAQSQSIANSLKIMSDNTNKELEYSNSTVRYLESIDRGISSLTASLARQFNVSGGAFDTSSLNLGKTGSSGIGGALFGSSTTRTLVDQGVKITMGVLGQIEDTVQAVGYNVVEQVKKKKFLGLTVSNKKSYTTTENPLDDDIVDQIGLVFGSIRDTIIDASKKLGLDVTKAVNETTFSDVDISLQGLKGDEIQSALNAVFSKFGDEVAKFATDTALHLSDFQRAGEGAMETLIRLVSDFTAVDTALKSVGLSIGQTAQSYYDKVSVRESLVDAFGGVENLMDSLNSYSDKFLTDAEKIAPVMSSVSAEMARLGESGIKTNDQFKGLVNSLDLNTASGQAMFASLMAVAPAFAEVNKYLNDTASAAEAIKAANDKTDRGLEKRLAETLGDSEKVLTMTREDERKGVDELGNSYLTLIYNAEDAATATKNLANAAATAAQQQKDAVSNLQNLPSLGSGGILGAAGNPTFLSALSAFQSGDVAGAKSILSGYIRGNIATALPNNPDLHEAAYQQVLGSISGGGGNNLSMSNPTGGDGPLGDYSAQKAKKDAGAQQGKADLDSIFAKQKEDREKKITESASALADAYKEQADAMKDSLSIYSSVSKALKDFKESLNPLQNVQDTLIGTRSEFMGAVKSALGGDMDIASQLPKYGQAFLDAAKNTSETMYQYNDIVSFISDQISIVENMVDSKQTFEQASLDKMQAQIDRLDGIASSIDNLTNEVKKQGDDTKVNAKNQQNANVRMIQIAQKQTDFFNNLTNGGYAIPTELVKTS